MSLRRASLCLLLVHAGCGGDGDSAADAADTADAMPDAAILTGCRDLLSAGVVAPDTAPRIWRFRGPQRTQLHDTAGESRVLSPARDRLAIDLGQSLRILTLATGATRDIAYPIDLVGLDWTGGTRVLVHGRSPAGDRLDLIDPDTGDVQPVVADGAPIAWPRLAPDGQRVGFQRDLDVLEVSSAGGTPTVLISHTPNAIDEFIGWSGDGTLHAFRSGDRVFIPSTALVTQGTSAGPTWAPTGHTLLFESWVAEGAHGQRRQVLLALDPTSSGPSVEIGGASNYDYRPRHATWSMDSTEVVWNGPSSPDVFVHPIDRAGLPQTIVVGWTEPVMLLGPCP